MPGRRTIRQTDMIDTRIFLEILKYTGGLGALGTVVFGAYSYLDQRSIEAKRPFLEKQFELYQEAVLATSHLSTVTCRADDTACVELYRDNCQKFQKLYWGSLGVVEDRRVEQAMMAFHDAFRQRNPDFCTPGAVEELATAPKPFHNAMAKSSLRLAHCVNASVSDHWNFSILLDRCDVPVSGCPRSDPACGDAEAAENAKTTGESAAQDEVPEAR